MKKTILLLALGVLTLGLVSCNKEKESDNKEDDSQKIPEVVEPVVPDTPEEDKKPSKPTLDEDILKYNFYPLKTVGKDFFIDDVVLRKGELALDENLKPLLIYSEEDSPVIIPVVNEAGYVGFYNVYTCRLVVSPFYDVEKFLSLGDNNGFRRLKAINDEDELLGIYKFDYEGNSLIFDERANVLYEGEYLELEFIYLETIENLYNEFFYFSPDQRKQPLKIYTYDLNHLIEVPYSLFTSNAPMNDYIIDLEVYNQKGYKLNIITDEFVAVYKDLKLIDIYKLPFAYDDLEDGFDAIFDGKLFYQEKVKLPITSKDYTFELNGYKYKSVDYLVDLVTGKYVTKESSFLYETIDSLKDKDGIYKYLIMEYYSIEDKILNGVREVSIFDKDLTLLKSYEDTSYFDLLPLFNNTQTNDGIIYDDNFNPISPTKINGRLLYQIEDTSLAVFGLRDPKVGLINDEYEILIEPHYWEIMYLKGFKYIYAIDDEVIDLYNPETFKLESSITMYDGDVIESFDFVNGNHKQSKGLLVHNEDSLNYLDFVSGELIDLFEDIKVKNIIPAHYIHAYQLLVRDVSNKLSYVEFIHGDYKPIKEEVLVNEESGLSFYKAKSLKLGENINKVSDLNEVTYFKFVSDTLGVYGFKGIDSFYLIEEDGKFYYQKYYEPMLLNKGETVYFIYEPTTLDDYNIEVTLVNEVKPLNKEGETFEAYDATTEIKYNVRLIEVEEDTLINISLTNEKHQYGVVKLIGKEIEPIDKIIYEDKEYFYLEANMTYLVISTSTDGSELTLPAPSLLKVSELSNYSFNALAYETFTYNEETKMFTSKNKTGNSTTSLDIYIFSDMTFTFDYETSSETNYDCLEIRVNDELIIDFSGEEKGSYTLNLKKGDIVTFAYHKDSSYDEFNDEVSFGNFRFEVL